MLGNSLVYRERQILNQFKDKLQQQKESTQARERKSLLESSSDESDGLHFDAEQPKLAFQEEFELQDRSDFV